MDPGIRYERCKTKTITVCVNRLAPGRPLSLFLFFPLSAIRLHPPLSPVFFFCQSPSSPVFFTSLLIQSSHLSLGLPRLLLPCSHNSAALFGSRSSAILSTCPAHCNLLLTSFSFKPLCTPVSSLNSTILRLSALVTLAIFRTQLFSHTCSLCCCSSVSAKYFSTFFLYFLGDFLFSGANHVFFFLQ